MANSTSGTYTAGLFSVTIKIDYNGAEARAFLDFLLGDLPGDSDLPVSTRRFAVVIVGKPQKMSLWLGERQLYFGESAQEMAYILINEIVYECITASSGHQAFHAAGLTAAGQGILLPGKSGSGKSSIAAWLTAQGCTYLSDELVLLAPDRRLLPLTRPLCLKPPSFAALQQKIAIKEEDILAGPKGVMIPHRLLNPTWQPANPQLTTIIFPEFVAGHPASLTPISSAKSCMQLLACHVNARNIPGHGFAELAEICRTSTSYELKFGDFSSLSAAFAPLLADRELGRGQ